MKDYSNIALQVLNVIRCSIKWDNTQGLADRELQILEHITREYSDRRRVFMEGGMS